MTTDVAACDSLDITQSWSIGTDVDVVWFRYQNGWIKLGAGDGVDLSLTSVDNDVVYMALMPSSQYYVDYEGLRAHRLESLKWGRVLKLIRNIYSRCLLGWVWVMGVGEIVEMDDRGRITIPAEIRRRIGRDVFIIELVDGETILLKAVNRGEEVIKRLEAIKLSGDKERRNYDAAYVKDLYGGIKD